MRKADIYFNGQIINTVEFDVINYTIYEKSIALTVKIDESNHKVVALVPYDHLIVIKDNPTFEIKVSDIIGFSQKLERNK